jgi:serine/threonine protein kinase
MIGEQISHYRLESKLGSGTFGVVYKGAHVDDPELQVAVKVVQPALLEDPKFVESLKAECRRLDKLDHSGIVRFRELVVREGSVAMVLELLEGKDLHDTVQAGPISIDESIRLLEAILGALSYAHSKDVVHRDIKPSNIFLCNDGRVKVLDFGIARAAQNTQATQTGTMKGTLDYMAPERFNAEGGGAHSDIYAVGLVAWELVAGRAACPAGGLPEKLGWHLGVGVSDVRGVRSECPEWLAELINKLSSKDLAARPVDGAAALQLFQEQRAGSTTETSASESTGRVAAPSTVALDKALVAETVRQVTEEREAVAPPPAKKPVETAPPPKQKAKPKVSADVSTPPQQKTPPAVAAQTVGAGVQTALLTQLADETGPLADLAGKMVRSYAKPPGGWLGDRMNMLAMVFVLGVVLNINSWMEAGLEVDLWVVLLSVSCMAPVLFLPSFRFGVLLRVVEGIKPSLNPVPPLAVCAITLWVPVEWMYGLFLPLHPETLFAAVLLCFGMRAFVTHQYRASYERLRQTDSRLAGFPAWDPVKAVINPMHLHRLGHALFKATAG